MKLKCGRKIKNIRGRKYNHWEVEKLSYIDKKHGAYWVCRCDLCGIAYDVRADSVQSGNSKRCRRCAAKERVYGYARVV